MRIKAFTIFLLFIVVTPFPESGRASATGPVAVPGINEAEIKTLANRAMEEFNIPGMAVGIVRNGEILYAGGHGVREVGKKGSVDDQTLFKIASNTKAFTTAALAILVDEGRVEWNAPVIDYIPEFRLQDPWITAEFSVADLLTHRSGLRRFVGDLLLWPEPNKFTESDVIRALKHFDLVSGFRTEYAYDNLMYIVAGEIVPRVTGSPWGKFVDERIMGKLDLKRCFAGVIPGKKMKNVAAPHGIIEGQLQVIERSRIGMTPPMSAAAGGIVCSLSDMLVWVETQLAQGLTPDGNTLFSPERNRELWKPHTWNGVSDRDYELHGTHFSAYGLGWRLRDVHGYKEVSHTGTLAGMLSSVVMVPELRLGVVYLSNGSESDARSSVTTTLVRSFMPVEQRDWIETYKEISRERKESRKEEKEISRELLVPSPDTESPDPDRFTGHYRDPWFGDVVVSLQKGQLFWAAEKSLKLKGAMTYLRDNTFLLLWADRTVEMDALVHFQLDQQGNVTGMLMNRIDEKTERSLDFEDLRLSRVKETGEP